MIPPTFVFDLDGTLVDTAPDLLATLNTILVQEGRSRVDTAALRRLVGRGARQLITEAFALTGEPVAPDRLEPLFEAFLADYATHVASESRPYPGVVAALEELKAHGAVLGVLTNKPHGLALGVLEGLGLLPFFTGVIGQGARPYLKPDPRVFADLLDMMGAPRQGAVMIGDSITDVETARAAGAPVILMSYGYTPEPAAILGADLVLDDFHAVPAAGRRLLGIS